MQQSKLDFMCDVSQVSQKSKPPRGHWSEGLEGLLLAWASRLWGLQAARSTTEFLTLFSCLSAYRLSHRWFDPMVASVDVRTTHEIFTRSLTRIHCVVKLFGRYVCQDWSQLSCKQPTMLDRYYCAGIIPLVRLVYFCCAGSIQVSFRSPAGAHAAPDAPHGGGGCCL